MSIPHDKCPEKTTIDRCSRSNMSYIPRLNIQSMILHHELYHHNQSNTGLLQTVRMDTTYQKSINCFKRQPTDTNLQAVEECCVERGFVGSSSAF